MHAEQFTTRPATPDDERTLAKLVVEGFSDQFGPVFGGRMDQAADIMEKWIELEHTSGGVQSLVIEGDHPSEILAGVGVRTGISRDDVMAQGLWTVLRNNLGLARATWAMFLLSYPRYLADFSEAYIERLVVSPEHRRRGMARKLLESAESLGREAGKKTVGLHVSGGNVPALQLYESEGYTEASRQRSLVTQYFLGVRSWIYLKKTL